ncbi:MAG: hypothetical protein C4536_13535 [Actinobacteria bacterium]|jgi:hypothetical protein|nr:MAG: hypothetical protein C4536_13535 [Actinomycetota bacterium]
MKVKISIPGPAKAMYAAYLSALVVSIYAGINVFRPFLQGWRYPWQTLYAVNLGIVSIWVVALTAGVYFYYDTLGRPRGWNEPLRWFRAILALLAIWYFLVSYALYYPQGWMSWLVNGLGGIRHTWVTYSITVWVVALVNIIYIYTRWASSERFPHFKATSKEEGVA